LLGSEAPGSGLNLTGLTDLSGLVRVWCLTTNFLKPWRFRKVIWSWL